MGWYALLRVPDSSPQFADALCNNRRLLINQAAKPEIHPSAGREMRLCRSAGRCVEVVVGMGAAGA